MADGFDKSTRTKQKYVAYQNEEHGLGARAARDYAGAGAGSTPRSTSAETVAALISKDATAAIIPIENDVGGYNKRTLGTLIDFKGYSISGEVTSSDKYVLAVPHCQVMELSESAFPSSFRDGPVAGSLPKNLEIQATLRRRIENLYISADAQERCNAAISGLRAEGMAVQFVPDGQDPYRFVMRQALNGLDPKRMVETQTGEAANFNHRKSQLSGANYAKPLTGVLIPYDQARAGLPISSAGLDNDANPQRVSHNGSDFVIIDDNVEGDKSIDTRFLALERQRPIERPATRVFAGMVKTMWPMGIWNDPEVEFMTDKFGKIYNSFGEKGERVRLLLKIDTRTSKARSAVTDVSALERRFAKARINYQPIVLNDRAEKLPTVYEIELHSKGQMADLKEVLNFAWRPHHNWKPRLLGAYAANADSLAQPDRKVHWPFLYNVLGLASIVGFLVIVAFVLKMFRAMLIGG